MPPAPSAHMEGTITCAVAAFGTVIVALVQLWNTDVIWSQKCLVRPYNTDCTSCCEAYAANHWTPQMIIGICSLIMFTKRLVLALYRDVFWDGVVMRMLSFAVFDSACAIFYSSYASDGVVLANLVTMSTLALFVAILCGASTALGGDQEESVAAWIVIAIFVAIDPHPDITMSPVARVPLALLPIIAMVLYARYGLGLRPKSL